LDMLEDNGNLNMKDQPWGKKQNADFIDPNRKTPTSTSGSDIPYSASVGVESILRRESIRQWICAFGISNPSARLVFVKGRALSAIMSTGHYRHWRLTSPKTRCSTLVERVH